MAPQGGEKVNVPFSAQPFCFPDPDGYARLRDALARANFTDRGVAEAVGLDDASSLPSQELPLLLRATGARMPLHTLIRLFLLGVPVEAGAFEEAVAPATLAECAAAGLVTLKEGAVHPAARLLPFRGLLVAFDLPSTLRAPLAQDYVMGIGSSTITLANATARRHSRLTLDLGTGCGILAFLAAPHSERVLAVDRNPRAVALARFNARLNAIANVECIEGDLFSPVQGHEFDLVFSNPPFVISPETHYIYRDSGRQLDEITQAIVRAVPGFLREGGLCHILCNWAHLRGQDWRERLAAWFQGTGCDAWAMRSETVGAAAYAAKWIRHTEWDSPDAFARRFEDWMAYYERHQVEAVSGGLITLRRRSRGTNWVRLDDAPAKMLGPAGHDIATAFELHDFLDATQDDERLLAQRLRLSPDARLHQTFVPADGGWQLAASEIRLDRGLTYAGDVDPYISAILGQCDGQRLLAEALRGLAASLGEDDARAIPAALGIIRRLIERGFLLPPDLAPCEPPTVSGTQSS
ncbi:MAG: class I SAM-dependent methyltransferase [Planctomycetes bacterium]|nr:class I SAM-dependent methyltransferase [Planctomycetota bacterium]